MRSVFKVLATLALSASLPACATRAEEASHLGFAAASPLRDVNVLREPIPDQLQALRNPYGYTAHEGCEAWAGEVAQLQKALVENGGRRVGFRRDGSTFVGRTGNLRDVGVKSAASQLLPFRGVVRQLSGAARYEQKAQESSERAQYRIGYLVGMGRANECPGFQ